MAQKSNLSIASSEVTRMQKVIQRLHSHFQKTHESGKVHTVAKCTVDEGGKIYITMQLPVFVSQRETRAVLLLVLMETQRKSLLRPGGFHILRMEAEMASTPLQQEPTGWPRLWFAHDTVPGQELKPLWCQRLS